MEHISRDMCRLGNLKGKAKDVKEHPWFASLKWSDLEQKRIPPPWKPPVKDQADLSSFTEEYPSDDEDEVPYTGDHEWYADF